MPICLQHIRHALAAWQQVAAGHLRRPLLSPDCNSHEDEAAVSLDFTAGVADIDQALGHHVELLQGVWVLRVLNVPDVLQTEPILMW